MRRSIEMVVLRKRSKVWGMAAVMMTLSTMGFMQPSSTAAPKVLKIVYFFQTGSTSNPTGD
jgi:hypothetical protein